jgi:DASS family divalent anion:Na+ symporter
VATIIALVAQPIRMGVTVVVAMTVSPLPGLCRRRKVLSGFSNLTYLARIYRLPFSRAVTSTGFGPRRLPVHPAIRAVAAQPRLPIARPMSCSRPSSLRYARGGGVVFPITRSVALAFKSSPGRRPAHRDFLVLVSFHATYTASAIYLTGMAANPLIAGLPATSATWS